MLQMRGDQRTGRLAAGLLVLIAIIASQLMAGEESGLKLRELTPEEERVILHKGTEPAFSGEYNDHFTTGTYSCRHCGAALYRSSDKFASHCGWPSFDDALPDAVVSQPDADGKRTEISCGNCGAHLGHVFSGEEYTDKNIRHCVNSISLEFQAAPKPATEVAVFAGGCFWGVEFYFQVEPGVLSTRVGYTGGELEQPTYQKVCTGATGHAEAIEITYDPALTDFETLARLFFEIHDPTQIDRQGPDIGNQYRSAIFCQNAEQKRIAQGLIKLLETAGFRVATKLQPAGTFWEAENYHQDYFKTTGKRPYCHERTKRF